nr:MAG TPA: hypothetical protein [Caudoviricetes sp.]
MSYLSGLLVSFFCCLHNVLNSLVSLLITLHSCLN